MNLGNKMNRISFVSGEKGASHVFPHEALTHARMKIYLDDKLVPGVKSMQFRVDLTYGYIVASIRMHRVDNEASRQTGRTTFGVDAEFRPILDTINPLLEKDALILESIENDGKFTHFHLRTIINV